MSRARLNVGSWGKIRTRKVQDNPRRYEASGRVRVTAVRVDQIKAVAGTAEAARDRFKAEAATRVSFARSEDNALTRHTTVTQLVERMIQDLRDGTADNLVRPQSVDRYENTVKILKGTYAGGKYPTIGDYPLSEVDIPLVWNWLRDVSVISPSTGAQCRSAMKRAFKLAMMQGVNLWGGVNPAADAPLKRPPAHAPHALTVADTEVLLSNVRAWQTPRKRTDLLSIVQMLKDTGMRPGELLALRWQDVDLTGAKATVTVAGTVVELKGRRADGKGIRRQPFGKTHKAYRTLTLPEDATMRLLERRVAASSDLVFPNDRGGLLSLRNIGTRWRDARGEEYDGVTLYDFRRTVATEIDRRYGPEAAAAQLGHTSPAITGRHYIEQATAVGDFTDALGTLQ
ncbi:tyrosine-type recombinase/integrase [Corynebacterium nuruki]|uniref:tyrosine-type recombinase/integrase n=1 Tax=Corynebacterium nuruki TaxID=1032851 RepID=UPI0039BF1C7D